MYDVIIIGAGMSGLAAGARLAHFGRRVCVLERHYTIGGLNSFYRLHGRDFDVGLHAVTNYVPGGGRRGPFSRILRQLRLKWDDFDLTPQIESKIAFPDVELRFSNHPELLRDEIAARFPSQAAAYDRLVAELPAYEEIDQAALAGSSRQRLAEYFDEPLLIEMLLCPLMYYGSARIDDMDWGQFCILFRSIYLEGFARPRRGVRLILKLLANEYRRRGGELKLRSGVRRILIDDGRAVGVELDDGQAIEGKRILSSAGWVETMRACDEGPSEASWQPAVGQLSFIEAISVLDRQPTEIGHRSTIIFFNDSERFRWRPADDLVDVGSGVICCPNNYDYEKPLDEGMMRVTALANYDRWAALSEEEYRGAKQTWFDRVNESAVRFSVDFRPHTVATDMFTPTTIRRFTGHENGAVYGSPRKRLDGATPIRNLFVCGTDQGFVGIVGAMVSGIAMANQHCLRED